jgi:thiamine biosynthesis protein ThiC
MGELVTIAEFENVNQAYVLKSRLEAEGIKVFLQNENLNSVMGLGGFASVKVQVALQDSFRAMDVLYEE